MLAFIVREVAVPCRRSSELGPAVWTHCLGCLARFLALVSEQIAEGGKLSTVAPVLPALRFRPALHDSHMPLVGWTASRWQHVRHRVKHVTIMH